MKTEMPMDIRWTIQGVMQRPPLKGRKTREDGSLTLSGQHLPDGSEDTGQTHVVEIQADIVLPR